MTHYLNQPDVEKREMLRIDGIIVTAREIVAEALFGLYNSFVYIHLLSI